MRSGVPAEVLLLCAITLIALGSAGVLALVSLLRRRARRGPSVLPHQSAPQPGAPAPAPRACRPYARIPTLLTGAEQAFFTVLQAAVPDGLLICPQVRLANLVRPASQRQRDRQYDFYRIQAKCVDFVLCEARTTVPRLVIELDDASHARADRRARDAFVDEVLVSVGIPMLHIPWQPVYDLQTLTNQIGDALHIPRPPVMPATSPPRAPMAQPPTATVTAAVPQAIRWTCRQCGAAVGAHVKYCGACGGVLEL